LYVVLILLVAWGWWGIATLRDRTQTVGRGSNSIVEFNDQLSVLRRATPVQHAVPLPVVAQPDSGLTAPRDRWATGFQDRQRPATRQLRDLMSGTPLESVTQRVMSGGRTMTLSQAQARRRQVMLGLLVAVGLTGLLALVAGGVFGIMFVVALVSTVAYVALLVRARAEQIERAIKVRSIDRQTTTPAAYGAATYGEHLDEAWAESAVAVGAGALTYGTGSYGDSYGADAYGVNSYA
jgi:hypothetical protein